MKTPVMITHRAHEVLYESEAALRLVDQEIHDLRGDAMPDDAGIAELPAILQRANTQILEVLSRLRDTRTVLQSSALQKFQVTQDKLREVTTATEDAATNILDACDRAAQIVDALDTNDALVEPNRATASVLRGTLRDELFLMMSALQFQDITTQQLNHASAVLVDMEDRLADVARLFDTSFDEQYRGKRYDAPDAMTYDPNASTKNIEGRQALADEIFTGIRLPAA